MSKHSVTFINKSPFSVMLETWQRRPSGLAEYKPVLVKHNEIMIMPSETGEWIVSTFLNNDELVNQWKSAGYKPGNDIGKFRNVPDFKNRYSWMYHDDFEITYNPETKTAIFTKKNKKHQI